MLKIININAPINVFDENNSNTELDLKALASKKLRLSVSEILSVKLVHKSLDARKKDNIHYIISLKVKVKNEKLVKLSKDISFYEETIAFIIPRKTLDYRPVIVGLGPAGLFAGLILARACAKPVILERGENVEERKRTVQKFWDTGVLDTESNVQFGEGGAGAFSDGKLTTGIKTPYITFIFEELVKHGAPAQILYEAKPHVGTDKLAPTVKAIRDEIINLGGEVYFNAKFTGYETKNNKICSAIYEQRTIENSISHITTKSIPTKSIILAAGHSARDVFEMLHKNNVNLMQKPFSVGVRIEHLQEDLNKALYGDSFKNLPPAEYKLSVHLPGGRSVYTFCMCPGGYVVASASEQGGMVTNGMSFQSRDFMNANSAVLVNVNTEDFPSAHPLAGIEFQRKLEHDSFVSAGSNFNAPVFMVGDFLERKISENIGKVKPSYIPGYKYVPPDEYLPKFVSIAIREALPLFDKKIKGFASPHAILTGVETRSSSPVRINRDDKCQSLNVKGLYPCGEGAGYAGGIVSAASDGIKVALAVMGSEC